jgi:putative glutamine amidotransferase
MMGMDCVRYEDEVKNNDLTSDKPIIAFCPDWRHDKDGNPIYIRFIFENYRRLFEDNGLKMHLLRFEDKAEDVRGKVHGWIIPGGRDIDPKFYGQQNTKSNVEAEDSEKRWNFCRQFLDNLDPKMPILGVCYGFQVLNCLYGGDMIQDLPNGQKNHYRKRIMKVEPGSLLSKAINGNTLIGNCYHHQGIGKVPSALKVTAYDEKDGYPHALEYNGPERTIIGVLWHPESTFTDTRMEKLDQTNQAIFTYFFDLCREYKKSLAAPLTT